MQQSNFNLRVRYQYLCKSSIHSVEEMQRAIRTQPCRKHLIETQASPSWIFSYRFFRSGLLSGLQALSIDNALRMFGANARYLARDDGE